MSLIPSRNPWQRRTITLQGDLACIHCTYNLRGLPISENCPECGKKIWDSLLTQGISALYRSTERAALLCVAAGATPLLTAALLAMSSTASPIREAIVITLFLAVLCLAVSGIGWFQLPVNEFQPSGRESAWIIALCLLSIAGVVLASIFALTLSTTDAEWIPRTWDAGIACASAYLMVLLGHAARILFVIQHATVARLLQTAQILCVAAAAVGLAALAMEFSDEPTAVRHAALGVAGMAGVAVMIAMCVGAYAFSSFGQGHQNTR
jgi:hypothetical protein